MCDKMLVTQALDERDLLVKKIADKIANASFIDTIRPNEDNVYLKRVSLDEFKKLAESEYQQINSLLKRYAQLDAALVASNANTEITTSYGTFTVAAAISLKNRLRDGSKSNTNFEVQLRRKMSQDYNEHVQFCEGKNSKLNETAREMRLSILGKDNKNNKDDKPLAVVEAYVKENTFELVDPLDIKKKMEALEEKRATLLTELDTQIKVSNATTFIEI